MSISAGSIKKQNKFKNVRILKIATALVVRDLILIKRINMIRDLTIYKIRKYILKPITFSVKKLTMI